MDIPEPDGRSRHRVCLHCYLCYDAKCAATAAAGSPEDVTVLAFVCDKDIASGRYDFEFEDVVGAHAVAACEPAVSTACRPTDDTYGVEGATNGYSIVFG